MKFSVIALLGFMFCANNVFAQTFQPLPGPVLEQEVAFQQANECYIFFDNLPGDTLQLRWRSFSVNKPEEWVIDLCDYGLCYAGIPPNGTMNAVFDTIQPYLKLIVQPGTTPGSAWLWFRVFEKDNESNALDVYFSLFTPGTTSTNEPVTPIIEVFPNPAFDILFVENKSVQSEWLEILSPTGQKIWRRPIAPGEQKMIDVNGWPAGLYYLARGPHLQKILIQK